MSASVTRQEIERHLSAQKWNEALAGLRRLWAAEGTSASAGFVLSCGEKLRSLLNPTKHKVAILRSFTLEPAIPLLRASGLLAGMELTVQISGFDTYAQQMLDAESALYSFQPDTVVLAVQTRDVLPELWDGYTDLSGEALGQAVERFASNFSSWVNVFRSRSTANLIIHNFEKPEVSNAGVLDAQGQGGQSLLVDALNQRLRAIAAEIPGVYILDYDGLVSRRGRARWHDEKKWLTMRMPIAADQLPGLVQEWLKFLHPLCGKTCKVLVTDLDHTLWGGVIGEDGLTGISLGREYPGAAHRALQRVMLDMYNRGILLAVASKNNIPEAMQAIDEHPEMLLRSRHFAAMQIHWNSKVESLKGIAEELNVGLDSLVFVDDNPAEREVVRLSLPQVTVIELPADSMNYAQAVRDCPMFERLTWSEEDRKRSEYYIEQRQRKELEQNVTSVEDYYRSLEQKVEIAKVAKSSLTRVAQLVKKTNQFNLTTRRHSESEIARMMDDPAWDIYQVRVADRFGDNGIVGVITAHRKEDVCEIDTFLLSCRVIGRTVETAILHHVAQTNRAKGITELQGWFLATEKNKPAEDVYRIHGFVEKSKTGNDTLWSLDLRQASVSCPPWIQLSAEPEMEKNEFAHA